LLVLDSQFSFYGGVPVVFDGIVGASREELSYHGPFVSISKLGSFLLLVSINDDLIFFFGPFVFADIGVQVVVPSLPALFSDPSRELLCNKTPVFGPVLMY